MSCARYGIKNDNARQYGEASLILPLSFEEAQSSIRRYFQMRGFNLSTHPSQDNQRIDYEGSWIRDSSLELYYLVSDTRKPHLVHWKSVWRLQKHQAQSQLTVHTKELVYMGPQESAGPTPNPDGQWLEAPQTHLRSWAELRRYFTSSFPNQAIPKEMPQIKIPQISFPPTYLKNSRPQKHYRSARPSAF